MKSLFMQILKYAGWTGFALYSVLMVYGLYTLGFKIMEPWLKLEAGFICVIFACLTHGINQEIKEIEESFKPS